MAYLPGFLEGCEASGIPAEQLTPEQALRLEPMLNPQLKAAVRVPDATMDAMRMPLRFFATAKRNGASLLNYVEVTGLLIHDGVVSGAAVHDHVTGRDAEIHADLTVNATGPWSEKVASHGRRRRPDPPSPGVMLAVRGRLCNMVINHLHASGDGDIVVPQRGLSIVGTSSWVVEDPDDLGVPDDHVQRMVDEGSKLIPAVATATHRAAWSAARPLIGSRGDADSGRELSRTFKTIDHAAEGGARGVRHDHGRQGHHAARDGRGLRRRGLPQARCRRTAVARATPSCCPTTPTSPHDGDARPHPRRRERGGGSARADTTDARSPATSASSGSRATEARSRFDIFEAEVEPDEHGPGRAAVDQDPSRSIARHPALVLPRVVRDLRGSRERPRGLACVTRLADLEHGRVTVEPMANFPVLADLVVDMTSFFERFPSPTRSTRSSEFPKSAEVPSRGRRVRAVRGLHRVRPLPLGLSGRRPPTTRTSGPPPSRTPSGCWRSREARDVGADPRLGRRGQRRVAMPRGVRVHRGVPIQRPPGAADHAPAAGADDRRRRRLVSRSHPPTASTTIRAARDARGPVLRKSPGPTAWFDVRKRGTGHWAFSLNRITGLGLVVLPVPAPRRALDAPRAARTPGTRSSRSPPHPCSSGLDVLLIFGLLFHGLNGLRVALVGSGVARRSAEGAVLVAHGVRGDPVAGRGAAHRRGAADGDPHADRDRPGVHRSRTWRGHRRIRRRAVGARDGAHGRAPLRRRGGRRTPALRSRSSTTSPTRSSSCSRPCSWSWSRPTRCSVCARCSSTSGSRMRAQAAGGARPARPRDRDGRVRRDAHRRAGLESLSRDPAMVGIVIVSHSHRIAEGVAELAREMGGPDVRLETAGGLDMPGPSDRHRRRAGDGGDRPGVVRRRRAGPDGSGQRGALGGDGARPHAGGAPLRASCSARRRSWRERWPPPSRRSWARRSSGSLQEARGGLAGKIAHLGDTGTESSPEPSSAAADESSITLTVNNPHGLHARPAARFVQTASSFDARVTVRDVTNGRGPADAASLNAVAMLGATQGHDDRGRRVGASGDPRRWRRSRRSPRATSTIVPSPSDRSVSLRRPSSRKGPGSCAAIPRPPGIAIGPARRFRTPDLAIPEGAAGAADELAALDAALGAVGDDIARQRALVAVRADGDEAEIFDAHLLFLRDGALLSPTRRAIADDGVSAARAWHDVDRAHGGGLGRPRGRVPPGAGRRPPERRAPGARASARRPGPPPRARGTRRGDRERPVARRHRGARPCRRARDRHRRRRTHVARRGARARVGHPGRGRRRRCAARPGRGDPDRRGWDHRRDPRGSGRIAAGGADRRARRTGGGPSRGTGLRPRTGSHDRRDDDRGRGEHRFPGRRGPGRRGGRRRGRPLPHGIPLHGQIVDAGCPRARGGVPRDRGSAGWTSPGDPHARRRRRQAAPVPRSAPRAEPVPRRPRDPPRAGAAGSPADPAAERSSAWPPTIRCG